MVLPISPMTYDLCLTANGFDTEISASDGVERCKKSLPFQVLSLGGATFGDDDALEESQEAVFTSVTALQRRVILMPGTQVELLVTWRDPDNCINLTPKGCPAAAPAEDETVVLQNLYYPTGGDGWPRVQLARATFKAYASGGGTLSTRRITPQIASPAFDIADRPAGEIRTAYTEELCSSGSTYRLAQGEKRRIYFAIVSDGKSNPESASHPDPLEEVFLLGNTILSADGMTEKLEDGTIEETPLLKPLDLSTDKAGLCVPFGAVETWQLVNLSEEVHNFHIHQGRFQISQADGTPSLYAPSAVDRVNVVNILLQGQGTDADEHTLHDTILVPRSNADSCSAAEIEDEDTGSFLRRTLDSFDAATPTYQYLPANGCTVSSPLTKAGPVGWIEVDILFTRQESLGKYMFHCHILEHEDLGMMSSIRVLTDAQSAN